MTALTRDQRALRGALIAESYRRNPGRGYLAAIQEGARRFREGKMPGRAAGNTPAIAPEVLAEAVAAAVTRHEDARRARKAAKKTAGRAAQEAAERALVKRMVDERLQAARRFSEASAGATLREASNADLAFVAATAMGSGHPGAARPVLEMDADPASLDLEDLKLAAVAGSAGSSPFWTGTDAPRAQAPFWRDPGGR